MQSVLNVRMDSVLKERGDKVLSDNGISVSSAVRALWAQLAETRSLPDFMKASSQTEARKQTKRAALQRLADIGSTAERTNAIDFNVPDDTVLSDMRYADMWARYESLS